MNTKKTLGTATAVLLLAMSTQAGAWTLHGKWDCCGKHPKPRAKVICKNGFAPTFVNVDGKWYHKRKQQPDGQGKAHSSLDAAARAFCKE